MTDSHPAVFQPLYADVSTPTRATEGAAGYDVRAHVKGRSVEVFIGSEARLVEVAGDHLVLDPGARAAVPLGFRASIPRGIEAQLRLRSSIAFRRGLIMPNAPATVDSDYPGEWMVLVSNTLDAPVEIPHLERIAQIVFNRVETVEWSEGTVGISSDRTGGLGSTGR
jgi:dUTP pyrophosphatase